MGIVFLVVRFIFGGYCAWQGAQRLNTYGRAPLIAYARSKNVPLPLFAVPLSGILLSIGGVSVVTGLFPAAGATMLAAVLVASALLLHAFWRIGDAAARGVERRKFIGHVVLASLALALFLMPQPWPLSMAKW